MSTGEERTLKNVTTVDNESGKSKYRTGTSARFARAGFILIAAVRRVDHDPSTSEWAAFPHIPGLRAPKNLLSVVSYLLKVCTLQQNVYARTVLSCVCFRIFVFELLDPEILSAASSILHPFIIESSGFDHIVL